MQKTSTPVFFLVDDDEDDLLFLKHSLEKEYPRCQVRTYTNGQEFMQMIDQPETLPSLIFLDLNMPNPDGFELLTKLRSLPGSRPLPIVILSVSEDARDMTRSRQLGASAYYVKPSRISDFESLVQSVGQYLV
ncbi:response regulator [Larkinella soli]|uniref:response regulator n=1 Tax=Larkinella soli TaxID=1770527 RepID=UPI000FFBF772|nr:response regulator [Larkinella soli]